MRRACNFMDGAEKKCVMWAGAKHSGKTAAAAKLAERLRQEGFTVGGILAPSVYEKDRLTGFDIIDIRSGVRTPLSVRDEGAGNIIPYRYYRKGVKLGHSALKRAADGSTDMIIVDEFGPLELNGKGWRSDVDNLLAGKHPPILLVVRSGLADEARKLYAGNVCMSLEANKPGSIDEMADFIGRYSRAGNRSASQ